MNTLENTELTALIRHIAIFLKSEIPIYNSEVPDTAGKKREEEVVEEENGIARRNAFHANAINSP